MAIPAFDTGNVEHSNFLKDVWIQNQDDRNIRRKAAIMKKQLSRLFIGVLLLMILLGSLSVSASAASLKLNKTKVNMTVGTTYELKATVKGATQEVKWSSSDKSIATVTSKGKVKAKKVGKVTIIAKCGKLTAKCIVTVTDSLIYVSEINEGDIVKKILKYYKSGEYSKADELAGKLKKYADEKCVNAMPAKMKKAYLNKLNGYISKQGITWSMDHPDYVWDYYLTDIDNDRTPELLIRYGSCEANVRTDVFSYKSNKVVKIGQFSCGHETFYAYPNNNGLVVINKHMGEEFVSVITIKNGNLKETSYGSRDSKSAPAEYLQMGLMLKGHIQRGYNGDWTLDTSDLK